MARNLVQEKKDEEQKKAQEAEAKPVETSTEAKDPNEGKIAVNQVEALIVQKLDIITALLIEGFKQVGVNFQEEKK